MQIDKSSFYYGENIVVTISRLHSGNLKPRQTRVVVGDSIILIGNFG